MTAHRDYIKRPVKRGPFEQNVVKRPKNGANLLYRGVAGARVPTGGELRVRRADD
jgi:hypothetical protein